MQSLAKTIFSQSEDPNPDVLSRHKPTEFAPLIMATDTGTTKILQSSLAICSTPQRKFGNSSEVAACSAFRTHSLRQGLLIRNPVDILAGPLGGIQGQVSTLYQSLGVQSMFWKQTNTGTGRNVDLISLYFKGF